MTKYTVVVTDENGSYDTICKINADTIEDAKVMAAAEAAKEWEVSEDAVEIRGVLAGHVEVIQWFDHPTENSL